MKYVDPLDSRLVTEELTFGGELEEISIDLNAHPGDNISIEYTMVDVQGAAAGDSVLLVVTDSVGPAVELPLRPPLEVCELEPTVRQLEVPAVTDACSSASVAGRIVVADGAPLGSPAPIAGDGSVELRPGTFGIEWVATDDAGNETVQPETIDVVLLSGPECASSSQRTILASGPQANVVDQTPDDKFVMGSEGGDYVLLGSGDDHIIGGDGADHLNGGGGTDRLSGGLGADMLNCTQPGDVVAHGADGADFVQALYCSASTLYGGRGNDSVVGSAGDDSIFPGPGIDTVTAGAGDDTVILFDVCELQAGKVLVGGSGYDILLSPIDENDLAARGVVVSGFEDVVVDPSRAYLAICFGD